MTYRKPSKPARLLSWLNMWKMKLSKSLITSTHQNIAADDTILAERLPEIKERTGVEEMVVDANYTGEDSERVCQEQGVAIIPTEVKGRKVSEDELSLTDFHFDGNTIISCPEGHPPIEQIHEPEHGRYIARFTIEQCHSCPWVENCPVRCRKQFYSLLFDDRQALLAQRRQRLNKEEYRRKCRLRPAIEWTISQFKQKLHNGKLMVRGLGKVRNNVILMAIGINFGRLWAHSLQDNPGAALLLTLAVLLIVFLVKNLAGKSTELNFEVA